MKPFEFPTFDAGTPGTLLDSENAKKVKRFIEGFNNVRIVVSEKSQVKFLDSSVVIELSRHDLNKVIADYMAANFQIRPLSVCDGDVAVEYSFVTLKKD